MTGVILCGGLSTRMGSDKGLLLYHSTTWAQLAFNKLASLNINVIVSVNEKQLTAYKELFAENTLIKDDASLSVGGPLLGIMSVHHRYPREDLFVLACDMITIGTEPINYLYEQYQRKIAEAFVFVNENIPEPLCGIYTSAGLKKIDGILANKKLQRSSMKYVLECMQTSYVNLPTEWKNDFRNFNSDDDLVDMP